MQPKRGILVSQCELQGSTGLAVFGAASPGAWDADDQSVFECRGVPACVQFSDLKVFLGVSDVSVSYHVGSGGGRIPLATTHLECPEAPHAFAHSPREGPVSPRPGRPQSRPL